MHAWKSRQKALSVGDHEVSCWSYTKKHGLKRAKKESLFIITSTASSHKDFEPLIKELTEINHVVVTNLCSPTQEPTIQSRFDNLKSILKNLEGKFTFIGDHEGGALCLMAASHLPSRTHGVVTIASVIDENGFEADVLDEYKAKLDHYKQLDTNQARRKVEMIEAQLYPELLSKNELSAITSKVGLITYPGDGISLGQTQYLEKTIPNAKAIYAVGFEYHFIEEHAELLAQDIREVRQ